MNHYEQGTDEWKQARGGRFTSSEMYRLMTDPRTKAAKEAGELSEGAMTYIFEKACELAFGWEKPFEGNAATEHGNEWEPVALDSYEKTTFGTIERTGFIPHGDAGGGSPDAIEDGRIVLEVKCPFNRINFFKFVYYEQYPKQYYWQVQDLMRITGCSSAKLIYFNPDLVAQGLSPVHAITIERNEQDIAELQARIDRATVERDSIIESLKKTLSC